MIQPVCEDRPNEDCAKVRKGKLKPVHLSEDSSSVLGGSLCCWAFSGDGTLNPQTVVLEGDSEIDCTKGSEQSDSFFGHAWLAGVPEDGGFVSLELFVPGIFPTPRALKLGLPNVKVVGEGVLFAELHAPLVEGMEVGP